MNNSVKLPTKKEAEEILSWAYQQNPGMWEKHSRIAARAAQSIAENCGLDPDRAYICGLLHDIGRYEGNRGLHHIYAGYELMMNKNYTSIAEVCLSHSFPFQDIGAYGGGDIDCNDEELSVITTYLSKATYSDYDKLIQLCDAISLAQGICLIDMRVLDVIRRYGFNDFTLLKLDSIFSLKKYFDTMCGKNIYDLFYDEIREITFHA